MLFQQHLQFEQRLDTIFGRGAAPIGKRSGGGFDCGVHFGNSSERNFSQRGVRGGIDELLPFGGVGIDPFAANAMRDADVRNCCGTHRKYLNDRERWTGKRTLSVSSKVYRKLSETTNERFGHVKAQNNCAAVRPPRNQSQIRGEFFRETPALKSLVRE